MGGLKEESRTCTVLIRGDGDDEGVEGGRVCRTRKVEGEDGKDWREVRKWGSRTEGDWEDCMVGTTERKSLELATLICNGSNNGGLLL